jgi:hypothetical protein
VGIVPLRLATNFGSVRLEGDAPALHFGTVTLQAVSYALYALAGLRLQHHIDRHGEQIAKGSHRRSDLRLGAG